MIRDFIQDFFLLERGNNLSGNFATHTKAVWLHRLFQASLSLEALTMLQVNFQPLLEMRVLKFLGLGKLKLEGGNPRVPL